MSEIATGDVMKIRYTFQERIRDNNRTSRFQWAPSYPSIHERKLWKVYMRRISLTDYMLPISLGAWIQSPHWDLDWWTKDGDILFRK